MQCIRRPDSAYSHQTNPKDNSAANENGYRCINKVIDKNIVTNHLIKKGKNPGKFFYISVLQVALCSQLLAIAFISPTCTDGC